MKTARSIEEQEARKAEEKTGDVIAQNSDSVSVKPKYDRRAAATRDLKPFRWKPGQSGNPGGRPRVDLAAEIARAIFENDGPAIYAAFSKMLRKGSPYAFQVLSDRAFGKLKESIQHEISPLREMSDDDLRNRIAELEKELGLPPAQTDQDSETKLN